LNREVLDDRERHWNGQKVWLLVLEASKEPIIPT